MTSVAVNTYTHSVTYVADNILKSMKDIIRLSGLDPTNLVEGWPSNMRALQTWLHSGHLETVVLEIFDPKTNALAGRWDIDVIYTTGLGDGGFWTDTEQIKYHVRKAGLAPNQASGVSQEGLYTCLSWPTARRNALFPGRFWTRALPRHGS